MVGRFINKAEWRRRFDLEDSVAAQFGVFASYPRIDMHRKYDYRAKCCKRVEIEHARFQALLVGAMETSRNVKAVSKSFFTLRTAIIHRDRIKLPPGYKSWAHLGAFFTPINGESNDVRAVTPASVHAAGKARVGRTEELIAAG